MWAEVALSVRQGVPPTTLVDASRGLIMANGMMSGMMTGMGTMGVFGLLILAVVVLVAVAAIKYLFFDRRK